MYLKSKHGEQKRSSRPCKQKFYGNQFEKQSDESEKRTKQSATTKKIVVMMWLIICYTRTELLNFLVFLVHLQTYLFESSVNKV